MWQTSFSARMLLLKAYILQDMERVRREASIHRKLAHPHIIQLKEVGCLLGCIAAFWSITGREVECDVFSNMCLTSRCLNGKALLGL